MYRYVWSLTAIQIFKCWRHFMILLKNWMYRDSFRRGKKNPRFNTDIFSGAEGFIRKMFVCVCVRALYIFHGENCRPIYKVTSPRLSAVCFLAVSVFTLSCILFLKLPFHPSFCTQHLVGFEVWCFFFFFPLFFWLTLTCSCWMCHCSGLSLLCLLLQSARQVT